MSKRKNIRSGSSRASELTSLVSASIKSSKTSTKLAANRELNSLGLQVAPLARSIQFGSPSSSGSSGQGSSGLLSGLLTHNSTGTISGLIGGGLFGFLGITFGGWIGYLIAGFIGACILIAIVRAFSGGLQQRT